MSDWLTYSPTSGHGNGIITITADTISSLEDRVATIIVSNSQYSLSASTSVTQKGAQLTAITFENLTWVTDVPASGGTATKDNCSYTVIGQYANGTTGDVTEYVTVSGSLNVAATTTVDRHDAGTLTLSASYSEFTASANVTVYQAAPSITGISFNNLTWVTDIAGTGGTATSANCSFNIYAYYTNGGSNYVDVTNASTVSGYVVVPESISENRHSAGTLTLTATYSTLTASSYITIYQEAYVTANYFTIEVISGGTIMWQNAPSSKFVIGSLGNVEEGDIIKLGVRNVSTTRESAGKIVGSDGVKFRVKGNIMSLFWPESSDFENKTNFPNETTFSNQLDGFLENNEGLIDASELILPATALTFSCYLGMFRNCTNLNGAPTLPLAIPVINEIGLAADLYYQSMFAGCTSLTKAPELPATTLGYNCYISMFEGCTSLTTAPELPATTLTPHCYDGMFAGCTSLTKAPELPATTLAECCYMAMFYGCTSLNYIKCLATDISAPNCTKNWVNGVASTGTFVKNPDMNDWTTGTNGIPSGWVVEDYGILLTGITISDLVWVTDIPASGGTADKNNCSYSVYANYNNGTVIDITNQATVNGSLVVASTTATTRENVGTLTLTAQYSGFTTTGDVIAYQEGVGVTGISFENLMWVTDIPSSGGAATKDNCSYSIYANYSDGTSVDVTSISTVSGSLTVPSTTAGERQNVGTLTLTAQYSGFTTTGDVIAYQEAYVPTPTSSTPLAFEILTGGTINWRASDSASTKTISYSKDSGDTWTDITSSTEGASISVNAGDVVMFKGDNDTYSVVEGFNTFNGTTAVFNLKGNIMSLINSTNFDTLTTLESAYTFSYLFFGCTGLTSAENLVLPATSLADRCYQHMFYGCTSLTTAPALPANNLTYRCYNWMFKDCTSLTTAPELPATTLAEDCYVSMFSGCTSLTSAPELPAMTLASSCYSSMFDGCTSLTTAPQLPATTLAGNCYASMFYGCTKLTTAPALPATTLANYCYDSMFYGCTGLTSAPSLSATTLAEGCYMAMFYGCTSLTTAPELPATTLASACYAQMFRDCTSLNYIKCLATDISENLCTNMWVGRVASSGTFVKNSNMSSWTTGSSGIPFNWTVTNAS